MQQTPITGAAAVALAAELAALSPLRLWEPVESRIDNVLSALRGDAGITEKEVTQLRGAVARWQRLDSRLRAFYAEHAPRDETASHVLWMLIFEQRSHHRALPGVMTGKLRRLWEDYFGEHPALELFPNTTTKQP